MQHTPGPWTAKLEGGTMAIKGMRNGGLCNIARDLWDEDNEPELDEVDANARLIAAAPELLAALRGLAQWVSDNHAYEEWLNDNEEWQSYDDLPEMQAAYEAIWMAEGGER